MLKGGLTGSCNSMCYWVDQYDLASDQCPNGAMTPLIDSRGLLYKAGDCVDFSVEQTYSDFPIPGGGAPQSVRGWYYALPNDGPAVALRMYRDPGCMLTKSIGPYSPFVSYLPGSCFTDAYPVTTIESLTEDASTFKVQECTAACGPDGYGCGNQANGVFDVLGLPQLSCPNTQNCLGACPTAQTDLVVCTGLEISGFGFDAAGTCACMILPTFPRDLSDHPKVLHAKNTTDTFMQKLAKLIPTYDLTPSKKIQKRQIPNTGCSLGVALVLDVGQNPIIQLDELQPLVIPPIHVIFGAVYEITPDTPYDASLIPFAYNTKEDPTWIPLQLNDGDRILLLSIFECGNVSTALTIDYDGVFNFLIQ